MLQSFVMNSTASPSSKSCCRGGSVRSQTHFPLRGTKVAHPDVIHGNASGQWIRAVHSPFRKSQSPPGSGTRTFLSQGRGFFRSASGLNQCRLVLFSCDRALSTIRSVSRFVFSFQHSVLQTIHRVPKPDHQPLVDLLADELIQLCFLVRHRLETPLVSKMSQEPTFSHCTWRAL